LSSTTQEIFASFNELLRYVIELKRYSQREIAEKLQKDESQISRYLSGEVVPYPRTQKKLFSALEVDVIKKGENWILTSNSRSQFDQLNEEIIDYDSKVTDHIKLELLLDDPLKTIEYAEGLIRIARLKLESSRRD